MKQVETDAQLEPRSPRAPWSRFSGLVLGLGLALAAAGVQAGNVYWSLAMQAPGVVIGASNAAPVLVYSAPPGHYKRKHHKRYKRHKRHWQPEHDRWDGGGRRGHGRY